MANFPKWQQPKMGHGATAGTMNQDKQPDWLGLRRKQAEEEEERSPWSRVQDSMRASGAGQRLPDYLRPQEKPFMVPNGTVKGMGPYVPGGRPATTTSSWVGGPLGAVPNHHGWAGLTEPTKQWALRLLGAFPDLRFSSGYRDPARNKAVGGVANSGHMRGVKIDISGNHKRLAEAAAWAKSFGARTLLHDAGNGYHLDISWDGVPL